MEEAMTKTYMTHGVCTPRFDVTIENGILTKIDIPRRGCDGNLKGITNLITGMPVDEVIKRFDGITCGSRTTSCPDQIAQALKAALAEMNE